VSESPEQSVARLKATQEVDAKVGTFDLEEIEALKIENLSLKQERLMDQIKSLEMQMGEVVADIRERLGVPEEKYELGLNPRDSKVRVIRKGGDGGREH